MQSLVLAVGALLAKACLLALAFWLFKGLAWLVHICFIAPLFDPLKHLPGPDAPYFAQHFTEVTDPQRSPTTHEEWVKAYGKTFRFHGFGKYDYRLLSLDFRVISHVLNSPIYEKPWQTRTMLSRLLGRGIFAMEGAEHKIQRRLIAPAFTTNAVKSLSPIFFQKAEELRDRWDAIISEVPSYPNRASDDKTDLASVDVAHWLSRATFDVIGLAGFDYNFNSLQDETEEMYLAYRKMFDIANMSNGPRCILQLYFPWVEKFFPNENERITHECLRTIKRCGTKIVTEKKTVTLAEKVCAEEIRKKDILGLLIKANLSSDPNTRMSDAELLDQLSTFLFAGSDSTSTAIAWCIHLLTTHMDIQTRLRDEILSLSRSSPSSRASTPSLNEDDDDPSPPTSASSFNSMYSEHAEADAIDALPLLDAVVRETFRLCPPVHGTLRIATQTDTIPVSSPVVLRDGTRVHPGESITIGKGSFIHIPIEGLNFSKDIWGPDALEFNPDRWSDLPKTARAHPGLANVMTFSLGSHACPGWKFTLVEMKVFLATLLPYFVFKPAAEIRKCNAILTRPYVHDQGHLGSQLPVCIERYAP